MPVGAGGAARAASWLAGSCQRQRQASAAAPEPAEKGNKFRDVGSQAEALSRILFGHSGLCLPGCWIPE